MTKVEAAKKAINEVFSDTSKPQIETREELLELHAEIENCLEALTEIEDFESEEFV